MIPRLILILVVWASAPVQAQPVATPDTNALDVRVLQAVYASPPGVASVWRAADWTSYKVFVGAPAVVWTAAWSGHGEKAFAYRLTLVEGAAFISYYGIKRLVRRARPYDAVPGIASRRSHGSESLESLFDPYSFPSGHATAAFALATTFALEHGRWYVVVPGALWATSVAMSRVWLGVHYPSDVLIGGLLGVGLAVAIHELGDVLTPASLQERPAAAVPSVTVRIPIR